MPDCIYEGGRALYIHPDECVEDDLPEDQKLHPADNEASFAEALPGRDAPLGSPGGAAKLGPLGVDTPLVAGQPSAAPSDGA
jgi:hypothetical protein